MPYRPSLTHGTATKMRDARPYVCLQLRVRRHGSTMAIDVKTTSDNLLLRSLHWHSCIAFPIAFIIVSQIIFSAFWGLGILLLLWLMIQFWQVCNAHIDQLASRLQMSKKDLQPRDRFDFCQKLLLWNCWVRRGDHAISHTLFFIMLYLAAAISARTVTPFVACCAVLGAAVVLAFASVHVARIQTNKCRDMGLTCPECQLPIIGVEAESALVSGSCVHCNHKLFENSEGC